MTLGIRKSEYSSKCRKLHALWPERVELTGSNILPREEARLPGAREEQGHPPHLSPSGCQDLGQTESKTAETLLGLGRASSMLLLCALGAKLHSHRLTA